MNNPIFIKREDITPVNKANNENPWWKSGAPVNATGPVNKHENEKPWWQSGAPVIITK